jgi:hypothetical protein
MPNRLHVWRRLAPCADLTIFGSHSAQSPNSSVPSETVLTDGTSGPSVSFHFLKYLFDEAVLGALTSAGSVCPKSFFLLLVLCPYEAVFGTTLRLARSSSHSALITRMITTDMFYEDLYDKQGLDCGLM